MEILMKSPILTVREINKKTKASFFKDLQINDRVQFSCPVDYAGISRGRSYAVDVKIENVDTGEYAYRTFNDMSNRLAGFVLEENLMK